MPTPSNASNPRAARSPPISITTASSTPCAAPAPTPSGPAGVSLPDPRFVERVTEAGIRFLGPSAEAMRRLGDKSPRRSPPLPAFPSRPGARAWLRMRRRPPITRAHRLSGGREGHRRRRRGIRVVTRPEDLAALFASATPRRARPSATGACSSSARSAEADTSRCRSPPIRTAWCWRSAAGIARCSADTKRYSRKRRRRGFRRVCSPSSRTPPCASRRRSVTRASARSSSWSRTRATSSSR